MIVSVALLIGGAAAPGGLPRDKVSLGLHALYETARVTALGVIVERKGERAVLETVRVLDGPAGLPSRLGLDLSDGGELCGTSGRAAVGELVLALLEPAVDGSWRFVHQGSGLFQSFVARGRVHLFTESVTLPGRLLLDDGPRPDGPWADLSVVCRLDDLLVDRRLWQAARDRRAAGDEAERR